MNNYFVYHIGITEDYSEGYVGVTNNLTRRWRQHKLGYTGYRLQCALSKHIEAKYCVVAGGLSREEAFKLEEDLRPYTNIGWNITKGGDAGFVWDSSIEGYGAWVSKLKLARQGRQPSLGMKHTEENKQLFGELGKIRWDGKRTLDKWEPYMFECGSPKLALELYNIPRTTYYRFRKQNNIENNESKSKKILSNYRRQTSEK